MDKPTGRMSLYPGNEISFRFPRQMHQQRRRLRDIKNLPVVRGRPNASLQDAVDYCRGIKPMKKLISYGNASGKPVPRPLLGKAVVIIIVLAGEGLQNHIGNPDAR